MVPVNEALYRQAVWTTRREVLNVACETLAHFDVPFFTWKGADFAFSLYPEPSMRYMNDIDLLVDLQYAGRASSVLHAAGFRRYSEGLGAFTSGLVAELKLSLGGVLVELHTHPLHHPVRLPGKIPSISSFSLSRARLSGGFPAPGWVESFLYTALHHVDSETLSQWQKRDLRLVAEKLQRDDWEDFTYLCCRSGWAGRIGRLMLKCGVDAPPEVLSTMRVYGDREHRKNRKGTAEALRMMHGWRLISFGAAQYYRILSGRSAGREG